MTFWGFLQFVKKLQSKIKNIKRLKNSNHTLGSSAAPNPDILLLGAWSPGWVQQELFEARLCWEHQSQPFPPTSLLGATGISTISMEVPSKSAADCEDKSSCQEWDAQHHPHPTCCGGVLLPNCWKFDFPNSFDLVEMPPALPNPVLDTIPRAGCRGFTFSNF